MEVLSKFLNNKKILKVYNFEDTDGKGIVVGVSENKENYVDGLVVMIQEKADGTVEIVIDETMAEKLLKAKIIHKK